MHGRMRIKAGRARSYQLRSCLGIEYECASRVSHIKSGSHAFLRLAYEFPKQFRNHNGTVCEFGAIHERNVNFAFCQCLTQLIQ